MKTSGFHFSTAVVASNSTDIVLFKCSGNKYLVEKRIHWLKVLTDTKTVKLGKRKEELGT